MNIQPVLEAAHKEQTTLTVYLCACLMDAISETVPVRAKKRPVVLSVPVNLRSHFPSASARNFFSVLFVGYDYGKRSAAFGDVVKKIGSDLSSGLALDNLSRGIDAYSAMPRSKARYSAAVSAIRGVAMRSTAGSLARFVNSTVRSIAPVLRKS